MLLTNYIKYLKHNLGILNINSSLKIITFVEYILLLANTKFT